MKTDSLFYRLFKNAPELVLELANLNYADAHSYCFCSEEIKQTAFRLDGILTPPDTNMDLPIIFVEVQFQPDPDFYSRFFCEIFFYLHQNKPVQPWLAVVIYPTRQTEMDSRLHYDTLIDSNRIKRIYIEDLTDPPIDRLGLQLIQLIVVDEKNAINEAQNLLKRIKIQINSETKAYWLDWVETIMVYKLPTLSREEIQHMLGYNDIELKQTRFYQDVFTEGEANVILRLLTRRFGHLNSNVMIKLQLLDRKQLETLADKIFDLSTPNELEAWLEQLDSLSG